MVPRSRGGDSASTVIKLDTVRRIAEKVNSEFIRKKTQPRSSKIIKSNSDRSLVFLALHELVSSSLFPGQAPPAGYHPHCSGKAELHPIPPDGAVPGPSQPQRREVNEAQVQPRLQQELQTPLCSSPQVKETLQPPFLR